jgi:hypothetical protein
MYDEFEANTRMTQIPDLHLNFERYKRNCFSSRYSHLKAIRREVFVPEKTLVYSTSQVACYFM